MLRILRKDFLKRDQDSKAAVAGKQGAAAGRVTDARDVAAAYGDARASKAPRLDAAATSAPEPVCPAPFGSQSPVRDGPGDAAKLYADIFGKGPARHTPDKQALPDSMPRSLSAEGAPQRKSRAMKGWPMPYKAPEAIPKQHADENGGATADSASTPASHAQAVPLGDITLTPFPLQPPSPAFISAAQLAMQAAGEHNTPGATPMLAPAQQQQQRRSSWFSHVPETVTSPSLPVAPAGVAYAAGSAPLRTAAPGVSAQPHGITRRISEESTPASAVPETPDSQVPGDALQHIAYAAAQSEPGEATAHDERGGCRPAEGAPAEPQIGVLQPGADYAQPCGADAGAAAARHQIARVPAVTLGVQLSAQGGDGGQPAHAVPSSAMPQALSLHDAHANAQAHAQSDESSLQQSADDARPRSGRRQRRRDRYVDPAFVLDDVASLAAPPLLRAHQAAAEPARDAHSGAAQGGPHDRNVPELQQRVSDCVAQQSALPSIDGAGATRADCARQPPVVPHALPHPSAAAGAAATAAKRTAQQRALDAELRNAEDDMDDEPAARAPEPPAAAELVAVRPAPEAAEQNCLPQRPESDSGMLTPFRSRSRSVSGNGGAAPLQTPSGSGEGGPPPPGQSASLGSMTRRLEAFMQPAVARVLRSKCAAAPIPNPPGLPQPMTL